MNGVTSPGDETADALRERVRQSVVGKQSIDAAERACIAEFLRHFAGEGVIDLVGFFQALKAIGYQGGVAPETIGPRIPDAMPPEESARLALDATIAILKKAGVA